MYFLKLHFEIKFWILVTRCQAGAFSLLVLDFVNNGLCRDLENVLRGRLGLKKEVAGIDDSSRQSGRWGGSHSERRLAEEHAAHLSAGAPVAH
jgi:hypothetical protein